MGEWLTSSPDFSVLHAEKQESLVSKIMYSVHDTSHV